MSDEVNAFVRSQIVVVEPSSGSVSVINAGPMGPPGVPTEGGGLPPVSCDYAVYTKTGWVCPPSTTSVWSGSGWVEFAGATFGVPIRLTDTFVAAGIAGTDSATISSATLGASPSDTFTAAGVSATDNASVVLT